MTWVITDTHFDHGNIIKYCNRPVDYEQQIIENWRMLVEPEDTIYHLGDVVLGRKEGMIDFYEKTFRQLPGIKILVRGNHDHRLSLSRLCNYWHEVVPCKSIIVDGLHLWLQHEPLTAAKLERLQVEGQIIDYCIHGHLHNTQIERKSIENKNILLALEYDGYKPQKLSEWLRRKIQYKYHHGSIEGHINGTNSIR